MPFWKKDKVKENGKSKEKVDYKSRLQHKQYLVRQFSLFSTFLFLSGDISSLYGAENVTGMLILKCNCGFVISPPQIIRECDKYPSLH